VFGIHKYIICLIRVLPVKPIVAEMVQKNSALDPVLNFLIL
jgi:hypothetical protein